MMPHPADTFDAQFRQVVADSKQLIPMEHQIGRIYPVSYTHLAVFSINLEALPALIIPAERPAATA